MAMTVTVGGMDLAARAAAALAPAGVLDTLLADTMDTEAIDHHLVAAAVGEDGRGAGEIYIKISYGCCAGLGGR